jgi:hypothetical protein
MCILKLQEVPQKQGYGICREIVEMFGIMGLLE